MENWTMYYVNLLSAGNLCSSVPRLSTVGDSKGKLVTIVVRDRLSRNKEQVVDILSSNPTIEQPTEAVSKVTNDSERRAIIESLKNALRTLYTTKMIQEPSQELILSVGEANQGIRNVLQVVQTMHGEANQERTEFALLLLDLSILLLAWAKYRKNPKWSTMKSSKCELFAFPNGCTITRQLGKLGIDIHVERQELMGGDNLRKPKAAVAYLLRKFKKNRQELATLKYILWCFGFPPEDEISSSALARRKDRTDLEVGGTSASHEYLHRELKIPRFLPNSTRATRQDTITEWIHHEKGLTLDSLLRKDINWLLLL